MKIKVAINTNNHSDVLECLSQAGLQGFYNYPSDCVLLTWTIDMTNLGMKDCFSEACLNLATFAIPFEVVND